MKNIYEYEYEYNKAKQALDFTVGTSGVSVKLPLYSEKDGRADMIDCTFFARCAFEKMKR